MLSKNMSIQGLALIEAIWARMCYGVREDGSLIEANDPTWDKLKAVAKEAKTGPKRWIEQKIFDKENVKKKKDNKRFYGKLSEKLLLYLRL